MGTGSASRDSSEIGLAPGVPRWYVGDMNETTTTEVLSGFRICIDCAMFHANGETPLDLDEDATAEWINSLDDSGIWVVGEDDGFGMSPCDCCRSPLGGDRFTASILTR